MLGGFTSKAAQVAAQVELKGGLVLGGFSGFISKAAQVELNRGLVLV